MTTATTAAQVRKHYSAVRTMMRNTRLGRYEGRNNGGDYTYRQRQGDELLATLPHRLQGLLTHEHKLAIRLGENQDLRQDRPELRDRMTTLRRELREEVASHEER